MVGIQCVLSKWMNEWITEEMNNSFSLKAWHKNWPGHDSQPKPSRVWFQKTEAVQCFIIKVCEQESTFPRNGQEVSFNFILSFNYYFLPIFYKIVAHKKNNLNIIVFKK